MTTTAPAVPNARQDNNIIRTMIRGVYDLQQIRIQMGNRITTNFKARLGLTQDGMSERELEKQEKGILDMLRLDYRRLTDGIVTEGEEAINAKLPTPKRFKSGEVISTWTELVLVDQYMTLLKDEETNFRRIGKVLEDIPIFQSFLKEVDGVGPAIAGIIISEIDIHKAEYPSSLWAYAGLDAVTVGVYMDENNKEFTVAPYQIDAYYLENDVNKPMLMHGRYEVTFKSVGRSRKDFCLVDREYINKEGNVATRKSITYNPFLKTKLIGVLGTSFLRSGTSTVDGKKTGGAKRKEMAEKIGFVLNKELEADEAEQVIAFLRTRGYDVVVEPCKYAKVYYSYKARLENDPRHTSKSPGHRHNMALRYAVKQFLAALYVEWRKLEGLPVAPSYAEAKLGLVHGKMTESKAEFYENRKA